MKMLSIAAVSVLGLVLATALGAAPLKLAPASPQPSPRPGLAVKYTYLGEPPLKYQSIDEARQHVVAAGKPGRPLRGLDYRDTSEGDPVLTHPEHFNVAADITGFIRFDAPGTYELETWSNDGVDARISGQQVGYFFERQPCEPNQRVTVEVPRAGWYPLKIYYFQKYSSSCLMMKWGRPGDKLSWVPNGAFGY